MEKRSNSNRSNGNKLSYFMYEEVIKNLFAGYFGQKQKY